MLNPAKGRAAIDKGLKIECRDFKAAPALSKNHRPVLFIRDLAKCNRKRRASLNTAETGPLRRLLIEAKLALQLFGQFE